MGASQSTEESKFTAQIAYEDDYVQPLLVAALKARLPPSSYELVTNTTTPTEPLKRPLLQILPYEQISFELALENPDKMLINAYVIRKALIRKHFLAATVAGWVAKRPNSVLKNHFKVGVRLDIDYAEYLDEALSEAYEVRDSVAKNLDLPAEQREWWILKPGMADGGNGIRLFSTEDELREIFEEMEAEQEEDDGQDEVDGFVVATPNMYASQLRYFIAQPYIHPPLLFENRRKFHIRTYVLAVGALKVYVFRPMLALFAAAEYQAPWENTDLRGHLTNTCLQGSTQREGTVQAYWDLDDKLPGSGKEWKEKVFSEICSTTGDLFEAAARNEMVHFQTLPNAFEIFGVDFMVDADGTTWLLEVNAFPDFKQTGDELKVFVSCLLGDAAELAVKPFFFPDEKAEEVKDGRMVKVLDIDMGRR